MFYRRRTISLAASLAAIVFFSLFWSGCGNDLKKSDIALDLVLNPHGLAPLSAEARISLPEVDPLSITVTTKGRPSSTAPGLDITHTFSNRRGNFSLPVLGLYPDHPNRIEFDFVTKSGKTIVLTQELITPPLEESLQSNHIVPIEIFVNRLDPGDQGVYLVDNLRIAFDQYGEIRWAYTGDTFLNYGKLANGNLITTSEKDIRLLYHYPLFFEITLLGENVRTYDISAYYGHHDIWEIQAGPEEGNLIVAVNEKTPGTGEDVGHDGVGQEDTLILLDRKSGAVKRVWDLKKLFTPEDPNRHRLPSDPMMHSDDWIHQNAHYYDPDDNSIVFSSRHLSAVVKFDFASGKLIWILADNAPIHWNSQTNTYGQVIADYLLKPIREGNVIKDPGAENFWPYGQHAVKRINREGEIEHLLLYDNGNHRNYFQQGRQRGKTLFSRAVEYRVDRGMKTVEKVWEFDAGKSYYTLATGSVDLLPNGNRMIGFMWVSKDKQTPRVIELDPQGHTVFEARFNQGKTFYYQVEKFDLYRGLP